MQVAADNLAESASNLNGTMLPLRFSRRVVTSALVAVVMTIGLVLVPNVVGTRLHEAVTRLHQAQPLWLWAAGGAFLVTLVCVAFAWRCAFAECGGCVSRRQTLARYGLGSLANSASPARIGDALRIALFSRSLEGSDRLWTSSGAFAAISAVKVAISAALLIAASASNSIPLWPLEAASAFAVALAVAAFFARKRPIAHHALHLLDAFRALAHSPRGTAVLVGWVGAAALARVAAAAAVVAAFGLPAPLGAALVIVPALDLAGLFPITPGNIGVASAAVAAVLQSRGVNFTTALSTGLAFHAMETLTSIVFGLGGVLAIVEFSSPRRRRLVLAASGAVLSIGAAALLGAVILGDIG